MTFESDRGTEFTSQDFENFIKKKKLIHHTVGRPGKYQRKAVIVERVLRQSSKMLFLYFIHFYILHQKIMFSI